MLSSDRAPATSYRLSPSAVQFSMERLSLYVVVFQKRWEIGTRLLLIINRKWHTPFQITWKLLTLDNLAGHQQSVRSAILATADLFVVFFLWWFYWVRLSIFITGICIYACFCTVQIDKMFTVAVVQPDVVADDKIDLILEKVNTFFIRTHHGRHAEGDYNPPPSKEFDINFFLVNHIFETMLLLRKQCIM